MTGPEILTLGLAVAMAGAILLWRIQSQYCSHCAHCRIELAKKVEKRRLEAERSESIRHEWFHKNYPIKWGSVDCPTCQKDSQ